MGRFSLPQERPGGLDSPSTARVIKYMAKAQVRVFTLTNGRVGSNWRVGAGFRRPVPTLLLEHVGRTSGRRFTTPLLYLDDDPNLVVVASQGGLPRNPQWYANLLAHPDTLVHLRKQRGRTVHARVATPAERASLWPRLVGLYADFAKYAVWTEREIPVVILEPRNDT
ncbi:nitroreductase family deazaflavin-dependent oxidoreductase [Frankia sp. AgB1.9]|uniref:nitroreductase family deazaflavin-dependent oxidoreductase n=1 Tax=unclassified Frankia TaxID=2632575 RepID=UPI0019315AA1|nr:MULTISPECIES: nitroreductase family deazaflavin-dependent oxidoreductase [unclassified Frankia]MBL7492642.1 nitroreductase family deazaflavin-dependent oxidoreductase [Frankia sp. AgW1.1]MBL7549345.1 nitroreductase family deazaflavin-dependent oxidoreductase [Frankia sp. AgB1.9]MBL7619188.1 nitroreductase family deazaflavin-dependent oxidoreductase [Frankia sp. AgB1.8]